MNNKLYPEINIFIASLIENFKNISQQRLGLLEEFLEYLKKKYDSKLQIEIIYICTHNSRRSHLAQILSDTALAYYGIENIQTYSGGTETTAFNERAVKAMQSLGYHIEKLDETNNPKYQIQFGDEIVPSQVYSKLYSDERNPQHKFCAVMTCSHAEANCPIVQGCEFRIGLTFDDPKEFDDTELEQKKYRERAHEIGTELFWVFSKLLL